jgi:hypothetical protein
MSRQSGIEIEHKSRERWRGQRCKMERRGEKIVRYKRKK